jgi:thiol-disulfide isomerase/thioredoxin
MVERHFTRTAAVAVALSGVLVLAGCSSGISGGGNTGYVAAAVGVTAITSSQRVDSPPLAGTTLDGQLLTLKTLRGHVVLLNVWGSWCGPCRGEAPALEATYQKYQDRGVKFIGINTRDDNAAAQAFVHSAGVTYPSLKDPDETLLLQFKSILPPASIPSSVIIDANGKVAVRIIGPTTEPELAQQLDALLSEA